MSLQHRLSQIIKRSCLPLLEKQSFHKQGLNFVRQLPELAWIIDIQKSRWNTKDQVEFTLNCGVFIPDVISLYGGRDKPVPCSAAASCVSARLGSLKPDALDKWWRLSIGDRLPETDEKTVADVGSEIEQVLLPFLFRFRNQRDVIDFLESGYSQFPFVWPRSDAIRLSYLAALYHMSGEKDRSMAAIARAQTEAERCPLESHIRDFRERLAKD